MPIHDWTRVSDGTFHDFHSTWIPKIKNNLNRGILPAGFYAMAEQVAGSVEPDVLTLQHAEDDPDEADGAGAGGTIVASAMAVAAAKPKLSVEARLEKSRYAQKANHIVIRHQSRRSSHCIS
jgi:hypothetical protein